MSLYPQEYQLKNIFLLFMKDYLDDPKFIEANAQKFKSTVTENERFDIEKEKY